MITYISHAIFTLRTLAVLYLFFEAIDVTRVFGWRVALWEWCVAWLFLLDYLGGIFSLVLRYLHTKRTKQELIVKMLENQDKLERMNVEKRTRRPN